MTFFTEVGLQVHHAKHPQHIDPIRIEAADSGSKHPQALKTPKATVKHMQPID